MSFPPGTEMFQFPGFASSHYVFSARYPCGWVAPFGYPRIKACSRLPMAFRSVPRPSSPPGAKASTECPSRAREPKPNHLHHHAQKPSPGFKEKKAPSTTACPTSSTACLRKPSPHTSLHTPLNPRRGPTARLSTNLPGQTCANRTLPGYAPRDAPEPDLHFQITT